MRIFCVGRNYAAHIEELQNARPTEPVIFMKPDTAILRPDTDFYIPDFSRQVHHEVEIVLKVCKNGKNVEKQFAHRYYDQIAVGIDFTARDLQQKLKEKGLPWELAKGFDGSAALSEFVPLSNFPDPSDIRFGLNVNGETRQQGHTQMMLFDFDYIVSFISQYFTIRQGDYIYTGTPAGVSAVAINDVLSLSLEGREMLRFGIK